MSTAESPREVPALRCEIALPRWSRCCSRSVLARRSWDALSRGWDQIDFNTATLAVRRAKKGTPSTHPIRGDEMRALRRLQREQEPKSAFIFTSERGAPFTTAGFARMIERADEAAKLGVRTLGPR